MLQALSDTAKFLLRGLHSVVIVAKKVSALLFLGHRELPLQHLQLDLPLGPALEGSLPEKHFVNDHPERVEVYSLVVIESEEHFWRHVAGGARNAIGVVRKDLAAYAKIRNFDVAPAVDQQIFGLDVPVDDPPRMDMVESFQNLQHHEFALIEGEHAIQIEVEAQVAAIDQFQYHVQVVFVLEGAREAHHVAVAESAQNSPFEEDALQLPLFEQHLLAYFLDRVGSLSFMVHAEPNLGAVAPTDDQVECKVGSLDSGPQSQFF